MSPRVASAATGDMIRDASFVKRVADVVTARAAMSARGDMPYC